MRGEPAAGPGDPTPVRLVTLHIWQVPRRALPRALARMAVDPRRLRATPGVRFGKLLGTGDGDGFGPTDADLTRWAALVVWADPDRAAGFDDTPVGRGWRRLAVADARIDLCPLASRGRWSGVEPFGDPRRGTPDGPVLALTRARLRPHRATSFWRAVPPVAAALRDAPGLLARFGIGEAPLGWQGTVSVWRAATYLRDFAYRSSEHRAAIIRTSTRRWYAEELFARFEIRDLVGDPTVLNWVGSDDDPQFRRWPRDRSGQA
ncbi:monooxygenase [Plantactinospora solaniradicis]|uniref:Monooxygenase n=1 Tax=Plantactinospora solaniradicis TaxID=1723736 RepID=A0ABW1KFU6_9ACTN